MVPRVTSLKAENRFLLEFAFPTLKGWSWHTLIWRSIPPPPSSPHAPGRQGSPCSREGAKTHCMLRSHCIGQVCQCGQGPGEWLQSYFLCAPLPGQHWLGHHFFMVSELLCPMRWPPAPAQHQNISNSSLTPHLPSLPPCSPLSPSPCLDSSLVFSSVAPPGLFPTHSDASVERHKP